MNQTRRMKTIQISAWIAVWSASLLGNGDLLAQPEGVSNGSFANLFLTDQAPFVRFNPTGNDLEIEAQDNKLIFNHLDVGQAVHESSLSGFTTTEILELSRTGAKIPRQLTIDKTVNDPKSLFGVCIEYPENEMMGIAAIWALPKFIGFGYSNNFPLLVSDDSRTQAMVIREKGVGIGTYMPTAPIHVYSKGLALQNALPGSANGGTFENARIVVENDHPTPGFREMFALVNNGASRFTIENTNNNVKWGFASDALGRFTFSEDSSDGPEFAITPSGRVIMGPGSSQTFDLRPNGNLFITGTLNQSSDENLKTAFAGIDDDMILQKISHLPISSWQFKFDKPDVRHVGPTAQEFYAAFGLGESNTTIAPVDGIGVSLVGIQALNEKVEQQEKLIGKLLDRIEKLESRLNQ